MKSGVRAGMRILPLVLLFSLTGRAETVNGRLFGRAVSFQSEAMPIPENAGLQQMLKIKMLGRNLELVKWVTGTDSMGSPVADLYLKGFRVMSEVIQGKEETLFSATLPPGKITLPLIQAPLGPVIVGVDGGLEWSGHLQAGVGLGGWSTEADLLADAFLEGSGGAILLRGGIQGRLKLVKGALGFHLPFSNPASVVPFGSAQVLAGDVRGVLERRTLLGGWKTVLQKTFFQWPGRCIDFEGGGCGAF